MIRELIAHSVMFRTSMHLSIGVQEHYCVTVNQQKHDALLFNDRTFESLLDVFRVTTKPQTTTSMFFF